MYICIYDCVVQFSEITKEWSSDSISLQDLLIRFVVMWFWLEHKISFNLVEGWIEDCWNGITINLWLWACLEILCSSRSSCSSCILRHRRFVVEVHQCFRGLNPLSFTDLWLFEVSRGFWAWFQWTLRSRQIVWMILLRMFFVFEDLWWKFFGALEAWIRRASLIYDLLMFSDLWAWFSQTLGSRQMIWMILLRMFSDFGVEVFEVLKGFEAWSSQSFFTSQFWSFWILVPS